MGILALFQCLQPLLTATTIRHLSRITVAMLSMTGRVTMLGLSRWAGTGGSYRTVQRFFYTAIPWAGLFWLFFRQHVFRPDDLYLLAGDEVVVTKAGKETHGLDRFFSGLYQKVVPGLSFFTLSLLSTQERGSFPIRVEQVVRTEAEKAARKAKQEPKRLGEAAPKRKPGRPRGGRNKNKAEVTLTPELQRIQAMIQSQLHLMGSLISLVYLVLDGHFGNNPALQMVRQCGLHLISKLRSDAALYFRYAGSYPGHGRHRKYGDKLDYRHLPDQYLKQVGVEEEIETRTYQAEMLQKGFSQPLNVVLIVKANLKTGARAHVVLFSSDLNLSFDKLIFSYRLRFQLEFNFRDAKQYWGLEDFMNIKETAVTNAANLALFMVNFVYLLLRNLRQTAPDWSVLDLKACFRAYRYVVETLKLLPEIPEPVLLEQIFRKVAGLGRIHASEPDLSPS